MQLTPEQRRLIGIMIKHGIAKKVIASTLSCSRVTIWYWSIQDLRTRFNIERNPHGKITIEVEATIICMRQTFHWGTARIQQGLDNLPDFMKTELKVIIQREPVQNFNLSRQSIHQILKKWGINRNEKKKKSWKFFRAECANELWQVDLKEFKFEGKKYYIFIVIDDYSRFILSLELFNHCPTTKDLTSVLQKLNFMPKKILADNGGQFKEQWKNWCRENGSEVISAHPYYPQDKGKVERAIRNLSEEYVYLIAQFPHWLDKEHMGEWRCWFNEKRFHRGVKDYPANLYKC